MSVGWQVPADGAFSFPSREDTVKHVTANRAENIWRRLAGGQFVFAVLIALAPLKSAHSYVDPNSVGPLYQFLFPLLIAIASGFSVLKRAVLRLWNRIAGGRADDLRDDPTGSDADGRS